MRLQFINRFTVTIATLIGSTVWQLKADTAPLKSVYENSFLIGNIMAGGFHAEDPPYRQDDRELAILAREYNCLTSENNMKMMFVQPEEGVFNFKGTDAAVDFAELNDMVYVGHALVWHSMVPDWIFKYKNGKEVSREDLIDRMRTHIYTLVGRYKGRIKYWDVVNEAIDTKYIVDPNTGKKKQVAFFRDSPWMKIIGPEYIEMAFQFAHEADPEALLIYNDYSMFEESKARFAAGLYRYLKHKNIPIHGIGFQGHYHLKYPSLASLQKSINIIAAEGAQISISELDVGILPLLDDYKGADVDKKVKLDKKLNPYVDGVPHKILADQADRYSELFELFMLNSDHIERVTFWGILDQYSWINDWPVKGRTASPLLFDRDYKAKPAYTALKELNN